MDPAGRWRGAETGVAWSLSVVSPAGKHQFLTAAGCQWVRKLQSGAWS